MTQLNLAVCSQSYLLFWSAFLMIGEYQELHLAFHSKKKLYIHAFSQVAVMKGAATRGPEAFLLFWLVHPPWGSGTFGLIHVSSSQNDTVIDTTWRTCTTT